MTRDTPILLSQRATSTKISGTGKNGMNRQLEGWGLEGHGIIWTNITAILQLLMMILAMKTTTMMKNETSWATLEAERYIAIMPLKKQGRHTETTTIHIRTKQPNLLHYPLPLACVASVLKVQ